MRIVKTLVILQLLSIIGVIAAFCGHSMVHGGAARGIVEGILYTIDSSSALIDGQILKEGDMIYGVKVVRIDQNKVQFSKAGRMWEQRIREHPSPFWKDPNSG